MTDHDRITNGARAKAAMDEFLGPAFEHVEAAYAHRLTEIAAEKPWETDKIVKLATALKIARTVRAQIEGIIASGKAAEADQRYAAQIERISAHKRSILGI